MKYIKDNFILYTSRTILHNQGFYEKKEIDRV